MLSNRIRIGLDLLYLRPNEMGGGETYARGLVGGLVDACSKSNCDFLLFLNPVAWPTFSHIDSVPRFERVLVPTPVEPEARHIWSQLHWRGLAETYGLNLLHSFGNIAPMWTGCAKVVTVHDLLYKRVPELVPLRWKMFFSVMLPLTLARCEMVLADSQATADDLRKYLKVPEAKLQRTWLGPGQDFAGEGSWEHIRQKYKLPDRYFLTVGAAPHKRIDLCAAAVEELNRQGYDAALVVAGIAPKPELEGYRREGVTIRLGHIPQDELAVLYKHAQALICSSQLEGFGLTILEAMKLGTPVIATERGAVPEVMGSAGILVEFGRPTAMAAAMQSLLGDPERRAQLAALGQAHAMRYSWQQCAELTLDAYQRALRIRQRRTNELPALQIVREM
jgi:glycosyltransferase involved in cell wall biosynthesis